MRSALAAVLLVLCLGETLRAQTRPEPADSADVLVLDHDFTAADEIVRIFLNEQQVYRAELSSPDVTLQLGSRFRLRLPRIYSITDSRSPSGASVIEIYPEQDGEYEIRPVSLQGSRVSTRLRLYRDVGESRRLVAIANRPGWEIGIEVGGGWHSGFMQSSAAPPPGSSPDAGSDIEACFSARNAPGISRLSMCVLGLSHQSQRGARNRLWLYTEPRLRLLGRVQPGLSNWELGALFRFGAGIASTASDTPTILSPGIYVARHVRRNSAGSGWSLYASYSRAFYKGFGRPRDLEGGVTPESHRVSFGMGWYQ